MKFTYKYWISGGNNCEIDQILIKKTQTCTVNPQ